jgi:hypothetical protein
LAANFFTSAFNVVIIFVEGTSPQFLSLCFIIWNRDSSAGIVARPRFWQSKNHGWNPSRDRETYLYFKPSKPVLDPTNLYSEDNLFPFSGVKLNPQLYLAPRLGMIGAIVPVSLYAFMVWTGPNLPAPSSLPNLLRQCLQVKSVEYWHLLSG